MHPGLLNSEYLSDHSKDWLREVIWKQEHNALYYCVKAFKHPRYGFGIYEGQCDKAGNTSGEGRWYCTEPVKGRPDWKGLSLEGCFKGNMPEGFSKYIYFKLTHIVSDCENTRNHELL